MTRVLNGWTEGELYVHRGAFFFSEDWQPLLLLGTHISLFPLSLWPTLTVVRAHSAPRRGKIGIFPSNYAHPYTAPAGTSMNIPLMAAPHDSTAAASLASPKSGSKIDQSLSPRQGGSGRALPVPPTAPTAAHSNALPGRALPTPPAPSIAAPKSQTLALPEAPAHTVQRACRVCL